MRLLSLITGITLSVACSPATPRAGQAPTAPLAATTSPLAAARPTTTTVPTAMPTQTPAPKPTSAPTDTPHPTNTPQPDYRGMRTRLLTPLSALIIALRGNDRSQAAAILAEYNHVADEILPVIEHDTSKPANALHSAIGNVRAHPGDRAALEQDRLNLLRDIP